MCKISLQSGALLPQICKSVARPRHQANSGFRWTTIAGESRNRGQTKRVSFWILFTFMQLCICAHTCRVYIEIDYSNRRKAKERAMDLLHEGKKTEALPHCRKAIDITHAMALQLIQVCRSMNVDCIVAPFEADGQLAYLSLHRIADYVITEDSDLMVFGCGKILYKLDLAGGCQLFDAAKLHLSMGCPVNMYTADRFRHMCILAGCDYIASLPGIGLHRARKFMFRAAETDIWKALGKIRSQLNMRKLDVTEEYKINFMKANATFRHMGGAIYTWPIPKSLAPIRNIARMLAIYRTMNTRLWCWRWAASIHWQWKLWTTGILIVVVG